MSTDIRTFQLLDRTIASTTMIRIHRLNRRPSRRQEPGRPQSRTVSIRLEAQCPSGIRGLIIQRELAYGDAQKCAFNETSSLIRPTAMAEISCRSRSIESATQGCVVTSWLRGVGKS